MSAKLKRIELFDYLLIQCDHKEEVSGETHWHVCHAGSGDAICVTVGQVEAMAIVYGLALYERLSVSEQLQILAESARTVGDTDVEIEAITSDELMAYLNLGKRDGHE